MRPSPCQALSRRHLLAGALALASAPAAASTLEDRAADTSARARAARRGLEAIYRSALRPKEFARRGDDYLWCLQEIAVTSVDADLGERARRMGVERARVWRRQNPIPRSGATVYQLSKLIGGAYCSDRLLEPDPAMHSAVARASAALSAEDVLWFDPAREPPPRDLPKTCARCRRDNLRGRTRCAHCGAKLTMLDPYEVLCTALIATYAGERYGVRFGAGYADVCGQLQAMRPYRGWAEAGEDAYWSTAYAVTHVVYTLTDYGTWRLRPEWLPAEYEFLRTNLAANIARGDPELMGEFVDTLGMFGLGEDDPLIRQGRAYLLATQNRDGGWGEHSAYHPTWTAVDGLRDFAFRGEGTSNPEALARAKLSS